MRVFVASLLVAFAGSGFAADKVVRTINVSDAAAMDALERDRPEQYAKVIEILRIAGDVQCETLPQMLKTQFDVKAARCSSALILTSYPAKRQVWFLLDDTAYAGNVVLYGVRAKLSPAK